MDLPYRPCVGIMLANKAGLVWIGRRLPKWSGDTTAFIWQMPQGGIDKGENPRDAALRELREETGYVGQGARIIGSNHPNPAIMSNICYTVLVENCRPTGELELDHGEDVITRLVPIKDIPDLVASGEIRHALVIVALYQYELWRASNGGIRR